MRWGLRIWFLILSPWWLDTSKWVHYWMSQRATQFFQMVPLWLAQGWTEWKLIPTRLLLCGPCLGAALTVTDQGNLVQFPYFTCRKTKGQRRESFLTATQRAGHRIPVPASSPASSFSVSQMELLRWTLFLIYWTLTHRILKVAPPLPASKKTQPLP